MSALPPPRAVPYAHDSVRSASPGWRDTDWAAREGLLARSGTEPTSPTDRLDTEAPGLIGPGASAEGAMPCSHLKDRSLRLLVTTKTDEKAIAAPAIIGLSMPRAASGRAATL